MRQVNQARNKLTCSYDVSGICSVRKRNKGVMIVRLENEDENRTSRN